MSNNELTNDCQLYKFQLIILSVRVSVWKVEVKLVKSTFISTYSVVV